MPVRGRSGLTIWVLKAFCQSWQVHHFSLLPALRWLCTHSAALLFGGDSATTSMLSLTSAPPPPPLFFVMQVVAQAYKVLHPESCTCGGGSCFQNAQRVNNASRYGSGSRLAAANLSLHCWYSQQRLYRHERPNPWRPLCSKSYSHAFYLLPHYLCPDVSLHMLYVLACLHELSTAPGSICSASELWAISGLPAS